MKYEQITSNKNSKTRRISVWLLICGAILFVVSGIKLIEFRFVLQIIAICMLTGSIMITGRFLLRAYAYRVEDTASEGNEDGEPVTGERYELFVDEITRSLRYTACRLELANLQEIIPMKDCPKELKAKKRYNYCPDVFSDGAYLLKFKESEYSPSSEPILISIAPDEGLLEILKKFAESNNRDNEDK